MNNRYAIVDVWKFIFSILFMFLHLSYLGFDSSHFSTAGIYVEFFFIVTGYFTMHHFSKSTISTQEGLNQICLNSIMYTVQKYKSIFIYSIPAVLLTTIYYIIFSNSSKELLTQYFSFPLELMLLVSPFTKNVNYMIPPLWYISAMMIVFPIFCCLCQSKSKNLTYLLSFYIPLFYYGYTNANCTLAYLHQLMRAFSALCLGILVYGISRKIAAIKLTKNIRIVLTTLEFTLFVFTIISTYHNWDINLINLISLLGGSILMFSNQSYSAYLKGKVCSFLGKISFVIYLYHWCIGLYINYNNFSHGRTWYFVGTMLVSIVVYIVTEYFKRMIDRMNMVSRYL